MRRSTHPGNRPVFSPWAATTASAPGSTARPSSTAPGRAACRWTTTSCRWRCARAATPCSSRSKSAATVGAFACRFLPLSQEGLAERLRLFEVLSRDDGTPVIRARQSPSLTSAVLKSAKFEASSVAAPQRCPLDRRLDCRSTNFPIGVDTRNFAQYLLRIRTVLAEGGEQDLTMPFTAGRRVEHVLFENGRTTYQIVVGGDASESEKWAAGELRHWLAEVGGAPLALETDSAMPESGKVIVVGWNSLAQKLLGAEHPAAERRRRIVHVSQRRARRGHLGRQTTRHHVWRHVVPRTRAGRALLHAESDRRAKEGQVRLHLAQPLRKAGRPRAQRLLLRGLRANLGRPQPRQRRHGLPRAARRPRMLLGGPHVLPAHAAGGVLQRPPGILQPPGRQAHRRPRPALPLQPRRPPHRHRADQAEDPRTPGIPHLRRVAERLEQPLRMPGLPGHRGPRRQPVRADHPVRQPGRRQRKSGVSRQVHRHPRLQLHPQAAPHPQAPRQRRRPLLQHRMLFRP